MPRYFLEVAYKGMNYSGFQKQENANTIQSEIEKALLIVFQEELNLTGSSRTDSGVSAFQNYFHFDSILSLDTKRAYNVNAILPADIAIKRFFLVDDKSHCRFDALYREYHYHIYFHKDPFWFDKAYHFPFPVDLTEMDIAARLVMENENFIAFSKRNTQVKTFQCRIYKSEWERSGNHLIYKVSGNRFLRGMVRGLVGTMLQLGRERIDLAVFREILQGKKGKIVDFSPPGKGLFLVRVAFSCDREVNQENSVFNFSS